MTQAAALEGLVDNIPEETMRQACSLVLNSHVSVPRSTSVILLVAQALTLPSPDATQPREQATANSALADVAAERHRQIEVEGWTPGHDEEHEDGQLAIAAATYANHAASSEYDREHGTFWRVLWPFSDRWWKPTDRRRDLVKAGALIIAEIERLDRAAVAASRSEGDE